MEKRCRKKLSDAIKDKNYDEILRLRSKLCGILQDEDRHEDAVNELKDMLDNLAGDKNTIRVAQAHRLVGEMLQDTVDYKQAAGHFIKYLRLAREVNNVVEQQRAHATLGRYYLFEAQGAETETEKKKSLEASYKHNLKGHSLASKLQLERVIPDKEAALMKSRLNMNIALSYELEGRINEAEHNAEMAVKICKENNCSNYDVAKSLKILAGIKSKRDGASGLKIICEALHLAETISDQVGKELQHEVLETKADLHLALGDFSQAKKCLCDDYLLNIKEGRELLIKNLKMVVFIMNTLDQLKDIDDEDYLQRKKLFEQIADCCVHLKALTKAVDYYKKMLEYSERLGEDEKSRSAALVSIAASYADLRNFSKAIEYYEKERELWMHKPKEEFQSRITLASIYEKKNDPAGQLIQLSLARSLADTSGNAHLQIEVLTLLQNYYKTYEPDNAVSQTLEDEIFELRSKNSSQDEDNSQAMDIDEDEELPYESIDLTDLPELRPNDSRESRFRQKRSKVTQNEKGETQLHIACIRGQMQKVQLFLKNGHPVTIYDRAGWAPIHEAANFGHTEIINYLLDHGANIDEQGKHGSLACDGTTPLIDSCTNGHLTVVELLLTRGAKVELKTLKPPRRNALNALDSWYKINKEDLSDEDSSRYHIIRQKMVDLLQKAGERIVPDSSSFEPEFVLDDDESQMTLPNKRLHDIRSRASQLSDGSDSDNLQMRRRKQTQKLHYSENDDEEPSTSRRRSRSESDQEAGPSTSTGRRGAAQPSVSEYRSAMDSLKRRNMPTQPSAPRNYNQAVSALVPEEEANQEWLEDDIGPNTSKSSNRSSKRRLSSENRSESASRTKKSKRKDWLSSSSSSSRSSSPVIVEPEGRISPEFLGVSTPPRGNSDYHSSDGEEICHPERPLRRAAPVKKSPAKRQRIVSSPTKASPRKLNTQDENINIRVKIKNRAYLVPINSREINIGTLAEKIAERYYKMEGMEPKLTLTTADGAILSAEDPVSVILRSDEFSAEICAIIESQKLPPLPKRYTEACKLEKTDEDEHILQCLEGSQATFKIKLNNLSLGSQLSPFVKAIHKEISLQSLDLSGCAIEDSGLELLCSIINSLDNLTELNLSCNYLTSKGLKVMSAIIGTERSLQKLRRLDFSHNMLGDEGLRTLSALLDNLELTALNISDCDLKMPETSLDPLPTLALEKIEEFNVSYNPLGCSGIAHLFGRLNAWNLKKFNVAYTIENNGEPGAAESVVTEVSLLFQKIVSKEELGGVIEELNLSGCNLEDMDIWEILSAASESGIKIEHLILSCNPKLTGMSFQSLMNHTPPLSKLTSTGCPTLHQDNVNLSDAMKCLSMCSTSIERFSSVIDSKSECGPGGYVRMVR